MRPSLVTLTGRTLTSLIVPLPARVLVAVSGGADSMALLHVLSILREKHAHTFDLVAVGVDHGLRPEAQDELSLAAKFAAEWDVPFESVSVDVGPAKGNLQARAREARWSALESARARHGCSVIATAHHADDRAETFLLRLLAGATADGLAVMPPRDGVRIRPFLGARARKTDILAHLSRNGIPYAEDPSNRDLRFQRVRVREEVLPLLERFNPNIVRHLGELADELAERSSRPAPPGVPATGKSAAVEEAIVDLLRHVSGPLTKRTREALRALPEKSPNAEVALPGGLVVRFDRTHTRYIASKSPRVRPGN